ncbi:hypothetical protein F7P75_09550 [Acinetobacter gandensis]|uniref:Uncharacterized protein n=1 Tax=Acinetobacter gandensis TaxID=1443941 RepID=A0A1A7RGC0_9GAMM|nr:hypothetical protein [Acinetobacter gandensis]KAB0626149.1 hypothetical protein F7P75_09550 [Acinetobacter gandensis]OBX29702.1 hypothetical protein A9J31_12515 [Acinetobacter gandensis]
MQLERAFQESYKEAEHLALRIIHTDLRSRVAATLFAIAQQHQYLIFLLLLNFPTLQASAFALLRPLCEAVIKGLWIKLVATKNQIDKYLNGKEIKNTKQMVELIAIQYASTNNQFNQKNWNALSSYVHSNHLQLQYWLNSETVEPPYSDEAIAELIKITRLFSSLAFQAIQTISSEHKP